MKALITGASSGLGKALAIRLSNMGYDIIAVGRDETKLKELISILKTNVKTYALDLTKEENIYKLYNETKEEKIDLLINSAGFGEVGEFSKTELNNDINMIDLNIKALHMLTKLYLFDMIELDKGRILNISSSAAFNPGPLMSTYYATKSYVYSLTMAIYEELRHRKSNVKIHVAVPGAFDTPFMERAKVKKATYVKDVDFIADYIIKEMFKNKLMIVPGLGMKFTIFISRFVPRKLMLKINYKIQSKKVF